MADRVLSRALNNQWLPPDQSATALIGTWSRRLRATIARKPNALWPYPRPEQWQVDQALNGLTTCESKRIGRARPLYNDNWQIVSCTPTAGGDKRHLTGTCCICYSRTVSVRRCDHVPGKLTWTKCHSYHQSGNDTHPIPNYPCWIPRKSILSLDKWTLFLSINTNSLTPTRVSHHLILETYFQLSSWHTFYYSLSIIHSNSPHLFPFTLNLIVLLLTLSSESIWHVPHRCHLFFFSHPVVSKHIFLRKY